MSDISIMNYKLYNLTKEYCRYAKYILNLQNHINRCQCNNIIDINSRNSNLNNLNDLLRSIGILHNNKTREIFSLNVKKTNNLFKNIDIKKMITKENYKEMYDNMKYILKKNDIFLNNKLEKIFSNPFKDINKKLMQFGTYVGYFNLEDALSIIIGEDYINKYCDKVKKMIKLYNGIFVPCKYNVKIEEHDKTFFAKRIKPLSDIFIDNCANIYIKNMITCEYIIFSGYFINDSLNIIYRTSDGCKNILFKKKKDIEDEFSRHKNIDNRFTSIYIKNSSIADFIILSAEEYIKKVYTDYEEYKKLTQLRFMDLMKKFVIDTIEIDSITNMYNIIRLLLLGTIENINIAGLLFDVTKNRKNKNEIVANTIYKNLRYVSQIKLKKTHIDMKNELERIKSLTLNDIDLEKQISLCKNMPDIAKKAAMIKIDEMKLSNNEYHKQLLYVKTLINYPWPSDDDNKMFRDIGKDKNNSKKYIKSIEKKMNDIVYGHKICKDKITDIVGKLLKNPKSKGCSFGLGGPPGVGKTLIAKAISNAMGLPFTQITLGGQNDGEILHGHGYTYSAAQPGMVIKNMVKAGSSRCIMYFDELDKAGKKFGNNEIHDILMKMTDPNTNNEFIDRFFQEITFPLQNVIFIFSYNDLSNVHPILRDRIEKINVTPYSIKDKINISRDFLLKILCKDIGFDYGSIIFSNKILEYIIENYTNEQGVRDINRRMEKILLKINKDIILDSGPFKKNNVNITKDSPFKITKSLIHKYLGKSQLRIRKINTISKIGEVNGMYATQSGQGGILPIQIYPNLIKSDNILQLTGRQQEVMKESVSIALTTVLHTIKKEYIDKYFKIHMNGFHIHTPDGSVQKEGPSAGGAFATAFASVILGKKIRNDISMTGEIESTGRITAIGGLRYKLSGAKKAGVKLVLVPEENREDIIKIRKNDSKLIDKVNLNIKFVTCLNDILKEAIIDYDSDQFIK